MVVFNARFLTQPISGVQRYAIEISRAIKKILPSAQFVTPKNILHEEVANEIGAEVIGCNQGHVWEQVDLPIYLKRNKSPLLLNLANAAPVLYANKIVTVHDVAFERFPENFSLLFRCVYRSLVPAVIKSSKKILTVSEFSKSEIVGVYGISQNNIFIIPNAVSDCFSRKHSDSTEKYILAVSSIQKQKNFEGILKAFELLDDKDHKLYISGAVSTNFHDSDVLQKIKANPRVKFLGRVSDDELARLYSGAALFVYPSFYEGFGIPPIEAQACGCPILVSHMASLPEVCGDTATYCDPHSAHDIAEKIDFLLLNNGLCESMKLLGYENIKRYSWEKSAFKLLEIIKECQ